MASSRLRSLFFATVAFGTLIAAACGGRIAQDDADDVTGSDDDSGTRSSLDATTSADGSVNDAGQRFDANTFDSSRPPSPPWDADTPATGCTPKGRKASGSEATSFQIDSVHSGAQPSDALTLPLCRRWQHDFGGRVSYPLISGGRVFVLVQGSGTMDAYALDAMTGDVLWGPQATAFGGTAAAAYGDGHLYAASTFIEARDAVTGDLDWQSDIQGGFTTAPPTAHGGSIYVTTVGGTVNAFAPDGGRRWYDGPLSNSSGDNPPTVTDDRVFTSTACASALNASDGGIVWAATQTTCNDTTGPYGPTALIDNSLYVVSFTNNAASLDPTSGAYLGEGENTQTMPAAVGPWRVVVQRAIVTYPVNVLGIYDFGSSSAVRWYFEGDDQIDSNVLIVGSHVVVGSATGRLYVLDLATGKQVGGDFLEQGIEQVAGTENWPISSFAEADGILYVPAGTTLTAY